MGRFFEVPKTCVRHFGDTIDNIIDILKSYSQNRIKGKGQWISSKESYNVGSQIFPNNQRLTAYSDPVLSLLNSFKFNNKEINHTFDKDKVIILNTNKSIPKKLNKSRYLYYVCKDNFVPNGKNSNEYFTQSPTVVFEKEKINDVYKKFTELNLIN